MAGAGVGGTPRGRSSTYEQRDSFTTLTGEKYFPPVALGQAVQAIHF